MVAQTLQDPTPAAALADAPPSPVHPLTSSPVPASPSPIHPSTHSPLPASPVHPLTCSPVPPPALPPLTSHESSLLSSFLILRYDLVALAETNKLHPLQLLAFAMSPAVQAHLAELKQFADQAFALRSLESRTKAIDLLEEVAKASDNQVERRRAASAILRGLNPVGGTTLRGVRTHSPNDPDPNPLRHRRHNSNSPAHLFTSSPVHPSSDSALSTQHSAPPPPRPTARPSPNFSHLETAELIGAALKSPTPESLATLHAFTAPDATLGESTAPTDLEAFIEVARGIVPKQRQHAVVIHTRKATDSFADILCTLTDAPCNATTLQYDFTLTRNPDRLWLLSSFKRKPESRGVG